MTDADLHIKRQPSKPHTWCTASLGFAKDVRPKHHFLALSVLGWCGSKLASLIWKSLERCRHQELNWMFKQVAERQFWAADHHRSPPHLEVVGLGQPLYRLCPVCSTLFKDNRVLNPFLWDTQMGMVWAFCYYLCECLKNPAVGHNPALLCAMNIQRKLGKCWKEIWKGTNFLAF